MKSIEQDFLLRGRLVGGELLLSGTQCEAFLEECRVRGHVILGIDFFHENANGAIEEVVGSGADFSSIASDPAAVYQSYVEARAVLAATKGTIDLYGVILKE